jgi:predicted nucleic acid-binding Zn ribbon protein
VQWQSPDYKAGVVLRLLLQERCARMRTSILPHAITAMPTYDYHCPANGRIVEVSHKMADTVATWSELCRLAGLPLDGTSGKAKVEKLMSASGVVHAGSLGSGYERPCDTGPCGGGGCGGGGCAF